MKKKLLAFLFIFLFVFFPQNILIYGEEFDISAKSGILLDANSGKVLFEKNADEKMYPASITKIMTAVLVLEKGGLDEVLTASRAAVDSISRDSSNMGILAGEELTVRQLLEGLLIYSAGDAANVLAEYVSGSIGGFVNLMNEKALELGMINTHFVNTHGEHDDNHYSTARDLSKLALYAMNFTEFRDMVKKTQVTMAPTNKYKKDRILSNTNHLLSKIRNPKYYYPYATGIKTGYTSQAGYCLMASAEKDDISLISVVMGAQNQNGNIMSFVDTKNLFEYAFNNFSYQTVVKEGEYIDGAPVLYALKTDQIKLQAQNDLVVLLKNGTDFSKITRSVDISDEIRAPVNKGDAFGIATYYLLGEELGSVTLVSDADYKFDAVLYAASIIINTVTSPYFYVPLIVLIIISFIIKKRRNARRKRRFKVYRRYR